MGEKEALAPREDKKQVCAREGVGKKQLGIG